MSIEIALILIVIILAFAAAWRWAPTGSLTASNGIIALAIAFHEAMGEHMPALKAVLPVESQPWLVVVFLVLTVAARFRSKATTGLQIGSGAYTPRATGGDSGRDSIE